MKHYILALVLAMASINAAIAANPIREGNMISGHVLVKGSEENIPYATVLIVGSGQGTVSNEEGQFELKNLPAGKYTLRVSAVGYKTQEKEIEVNKDFTAVVHFQMQEESFMTDEVVVSANRNEVSRKAAPVVVNVMSTKLFEMVNSTDLAKTLNYQSGLRVENNCQNCGFPQVRINGLEGPYSQILINSRPIISALSGVYGLEQIPVNMIERVEVVRGDSMEPRIQDGDLALVHKQDTLENGDLGVLIYGDEGEGTLKRYLQRGNCVVLQPFNPAYKEMVIKGEELNHLHIAGRVVETKAKW